MPTPNLPVHPGAAAFFNGTQESFMDRYGNAIYLTPMLLGALASIVAAAWRFLGVRAGETAEATHDAFSKLPEKIRSACYETQLRLIEQEIDGVLRHQLATASREEGASEAHALIAAAQRLDNLIHHRRTLVLGQVMSPAAPGSAAEEQERR